MKFIPIADRVLVKVDESETISKGGIFLPDVSKEEKTMGLVVGVGRGKMLESGRAYPMEVTNGDRVVFGKYSGDDLMIDGVKHKLLKEAELLAIQRMN